MSALTPAEIAEELVARALWLALTGTLYQDGSECDEAAWQDCSAEAKRAIANLRGEAPPIAAGYPDPLTLPQAIGRGDICGECHGRWAHAPDCFLRPVRDPSDPRVP